MGQEERKNKAKLEKTQINLATSNTEYENAIKALEDTTGRWNRDWKAAADKFQDLEEERLDFTKSSLWSFANVASTVCVSDDASCEKVRLALEGCEVEKDIVCFIKEHGTGQEIPDAPKYINFCRGDASDAQSEVSDEDAYSVAQFQRTINPAFRSSSPQPSTLESHHEPEIINPLRSSQNSVAREATITPQKMLAERGGHAQPDQVMQPNRLQEQAALAKAGYDQNHHGPVAAVPHDPFPMDGMTMLCRTAPASDRSSQISQLRPSSRDSQSECSNPTSFSSQEPPSGKTSPVKMSYPSAVAEKQVAKKKSGFFQSPFRRKSTKERDAAAVPTSRHTWSARSQSASPTKRGALYNQGQMMIGDARSASPEPVDPRANFQLNVGNNVFDVATPANNGNKMVPKLGKQLQDEHDPIAQALAELKGVKASSVRVSADKYHNVAAPAPGSVPTTRPLGSQVANGALLAGMRGTPPPSYDQPAVQRLGAPQPAFTSKAMQQTRQKYVDQTQTMFSNPNRPDVQSTYYSHGRPSTRGTDVPRATSPAPLRSASPRPGMHPDTRQDRRSVSPNPYVAAQGHRNSGQSYHRQASPNDVARAVSPRPFLDRPGSSMGHDMSVQLAPGPDDGYEYQQNRNGRPGTSSTRPGSSYYGSQNGQMALSQRQRSKSVADARQFTRDGRPILHFGTSPDLDIMCMLKPSQLVPCTCIRRRFLRN